MVLTTCDSDSEANDLARLLVKEKLAACVSLIPGVMSTFIWNGQIDRAEEKILLIKTTSDVLESLIETILEHHSYDTPEVVVLNVDQMSEKYHQWLLSSVK